MCVVGNSQRTLLKSVTLVRKKLAPLSASFAVSKERISMDRLKGKRALITGGTSGIGLETARLFLAEGARVAITGRDPVTLAAARQQLGAEVQVIPFDASDAAVQKTFAERVRQGLGGLDILFLNAGIADLRPLEQWDE